MNVQELNDVILGEVFEVLDSTESYIARFRMDSSGSRIVDAIMQLRAKLIAERPQAGVYTAVLCAALMENAVDAIVVIDDEGIIKSFNPSAERMFGYTAGEMMGQKVNPLMPSPYCDQHDDYIARYLQTGEAKVIGMGRDVMGRRKDGSMFPVHLALSHVHIGGGDVFAAFLREISPPIGNE